MAIYSYIKKSALMSDKLSVNQLATDAVQNEDNRSPKPMVAVFKLLEIPPTFANLLV